MQNSIDIAPNQLIAFYQFAKIELAQKQFQNAVNHLEGLMEKINNLQNFKSENALDTVFVKNHINGFLIKIIMFHLNRKKSLELIVNLWKTCKDYGEMNQIFYEWNEIRKENLMNWIKDGGDSEPNWKILNEISGFLHLMKNDYEGAFSIFQNLFDVANA